MIRSQTIKIYLADGTAAGIRQIELLNWNGQALVCPRARLSELRDWPESEKPGVYFLFGEDEDGDLAYVGEAENVRNRLVDHVRRLEFWTQVVFFTTKDDSLTKAHVKYLESKLWAIAKQAGRIRLHNTNEPTTANLPRSDRDAMEYFLSPVALVLAVLGFPLLQPIGNPAAKDDERSGALASVRLRFVSPKRMIEASGANTDDGFVVYTGSVGDGELRPHLGKGYRAIREQLLADGTLVVEGATVRLTRDYLFDSPSAAAAVLAGGAYNGREAWRDAQGRTLKELEEQITESPKGAS